MIKSNKLIGFETYFFFQAEDGIRDRSPSRGLGDVYKRQVVRVTKVMSICVGYGMGVCTVMNGVCKIFTMVIQALSLIHI